VSGATRQGNFYHANLHVEMTKVEMTSVEVTTVEMTGAGAVYSGSLQLGAASSSRGACPQTKPEFRGVWATAPRIHKKGQRCPRVFMANP